MKKNLKMIEQQMMNERKMNGVNLTINNEVKRSPYKVGIAVCFTKNGTTYRNFEFVADHKRFGAIIALCKAQVAKSPLRIIVSHLQTVAISHKNDLSFEFICTMLLNYICCFPEIHETYERLQNRSLGFFVDIDVDNFADTCFWCGTKEELEEMFQKAFDSKLPN